MKLTKKEQDHKSKQLAKAIIKNKGNRGKAWKELNPDSTYKSGKEQASRYLKKYPETKEFAIEIADRKGLSIDYLVTNLKGLTKANKSLIYNNKVIDVPDNSTQLLATKEGLKLHKVLDSDNSINNNYTQVNLNSDIMDKIGNRLNTIIKQLDNKHNSKNIDIDKDKDIIDI